MKLSDYLVEKDGDKRKCPICGVWHNKFGLSSHFHSSHNESYVNVGSLGSNRTAWNKGLSSKTSPELQHKLSAGGKATKGCKKPPNSDLQKTKISVSMKKAHAEGRAHNIGSSRWNNEPSWPEKFFHQVVVNEFSDKNCTQEFPFQRFSLDFAWVEKKRCIEIDGAQHERPEYKVRDERKDTALVANGWKVLRIKWSDLYSDTKYWIQAAKDFIHD